jgi:ATP-dependent helicase HrpB
VDPAEASRLLAAEYSRRGPEPADERLLRRLRFAGIPVDVDTLIKDAAAAASSLAEVNLARALPHAVMRDLDRLAPETLRLPRGRTVRLEYRDDGAVIASVKLQDAFGLAESPRIGPSQEPVTFSLLAPNGRPVQTTKDLRSFWARTYAEVRKELRGRYPRHAWPEDPR